MKKNKIVRLNKDQIDTYVNWYNQKLPFICDALVSKNFCHMIEYWENIDCNKEYKIVKESDDKEYVFIDGFEYHIPTYFIEK